MWDTSPAAQPGEARQMRTLRYTCAGSTSGTKQGFAWRRYQPECACPEGKSLPLAIKPNAGRGGSQMGGSGSACLNLWPDADGRAFFGGRGDRCRTGMNACRGGVLRSTEVAELGSHRCFALIYCLDAAVLAARRRARARLWFGPSRAERLSLRRGWWRAARSATERREATAWSSGFFSE